MLRDGIVNCLEGVDTNLCRGVPYYLRINAALFCFGGALIKRRNLVVLPLSAAFNGVFSQKIVIRCEALTMDRIKIFLSKTPVCYYYCIFLDLGFINVSLKRILLFRNNS